MEPEHLAQAHIAGNLYVDWLGKAGRMLSICVSGVILVSYLFPPAP